MSELKHKWTDDSIDIVCFYSGHNVFHFKKITDSQCSFDENDIKYMADKVNLFDDYVSVHDVKPLLDKFKSQFINMDIFIHCLEQLIKPKDHN